MKTFDIETFNRNKKENSGYDGYYLKDSTYIRQFGNSDSGYVEYETPPKPEIFQIYREFYPSGNLKRIGKNFHNDFEKGIWKEYDEQGNLIKETDYDKPFKFTWEDILKWMQERKIAMNNDYLEINRGSSNKGTTWAITWEKEDESGLQGVNIDGITGEVIRTFERDYPEE